MSIRPVSRVQIPLSRQRILEWTGAGALAVACFGLLGVLSGCASSDSRPSRAPRSESAPASYASHDASDGGGAAAGAGPDSEREEAAAPPPPPPPGAPAPGSGWPGASAPGFGAPSAAAPSAAAPAAATGDVPAPPSGAPKSKPSGSSSISTASPKGGAPGATSTASDGAGPSRDGSIGPGNLGTIGHGAGRGQGNGYGSSGQRPPQRRPESDTDAERESAVAAGPLGPPAGASTTDSAPPKPPRGSATLSDSGDDRAPGAAPAEAPPAEGAARGDAPEAEPSKPDPGASDTFRDLDDFITRARKGMATFVTPDRIGMDEDATATLSLNPASVESTGPAQAGEVKVEGVARLAPKMKAVLTGNGFTITTGQSEVQAVSLQEPTQWRWSVRAIEPGPQRLTVTLSAVVKVEDEPVERVIQTFDRTVEVNADTVETITRFVMANWEFVFGSLILPFGAWAWSLRTGKRQEEDES